MAHGWSFLNILSSGWMMGHQQKEFVSCPFFKEEALPMGNHSTRRLSNRKTYLLSSVYLQFCMLST